VEDLKQFSLCSWACYETSTNIRWESTSIHCKSLFANDLQSTAEKQLQHLTFAKDLYIHTDPVGDEADDESSIDDETLEQYKASELALPNFKSIIEHCNPRILTTLWFSCLCFPDELHDDYVSIICANLTMLKCLVLMDSSVTDASLVNMTKLVHLEELHMYTEGVISDTGLSSVISALDLHALDLNGYFYYYGDNHNNTGGILHKAVTDLGMSDISLLTNLKHLDLSLTNITDVTLLRISTLKSLGLVNISETLVTDRGVSQLTHLTNLHNLSMFGCRDVGDASLYYVSKIPTLKYLDVGRTCISDSGVAYLQPLKSLQHLCLGYNYHITEAVVPYLTAMESLVGVNVCFTSMTTSGFQELKDLTNGTMCNLDLPTPPEDDNDIEFDMSCKHLGTDFRFKLSEMSMEALLQFPFPPPDPLDPPVVDVQEEQEEQLFPE